MRKNKSRKIHTLKSNHKKMEQNNKIITMNEVERPDLNIQAYDPISGEQLTTASNMRHDHAEILKKNAAFLIESSEKIDYDPQVIKDMKLCFEQEEYDDVLDLAYLHDRKKRPTAPARRMSDEEFEEFEKNCTLKSRLMDLVSTFEGDNEYISLIRNYLVVALQKMNGELNYENRAQARECIKKALECLRKFDDGQKIRQDLSN